MSWDSSTSGTLLGSHEGRMERRQTIGILLSSLDHPVLVNPKRFSIGRYQTGDARDLNGRLVDVFEDIRIEVQGQGNELAAISDHYLASLQEIGTQAFALLPDGLWDYLESLEQKARGRGISLDFTFPAGSLLWEMVYTGDPADDEISPEKFWGFRYPIGHLYWDTEPQGVIQLNHGVFASSHEQLEYSGYELTRIEHKLHETEQRLRRRLVLRRLADARCSNDLLRLFESEDFLYGIVHFACHCTNPLEGASLATLELKVDDCELEISPGTFQAFASHKHAFNCQPMVFLNACQSATPLHLLQSLDFPSSLLSFGAGGVVATFCTIPDNFASAFAVEFYSRLLDKLMNAASAKASIGEALLETRLHFLREYNNPLGLAYGHYAFSDQQLVVD